MTTWKSYEILCDPNLLCVNARIYTLQWQSFRLAKLYTMIWSLLIILSNVVTSIPINRHFAVLRCHVSIASVEIWSCSRWCVRWTHFQNKKKRRKKKKSQQRRKQATEANWLSSFHLRTSRQYTIQYRYIHNMCSIYFASMYLYLCTIFIMYEGKHSYYSVNIRNWRQLVRNCEIVTRKTW